jgi:nicotinate-nucleotide adenylyltransferase
LPAPQVQRSERIGILGGTFDPPHVGHAAAVLAVQEALHLDRLLLVVANDPWQKSATRMITPAATRLAMVQALAQGVPGVEASAMEIDRGGPSYTVETVEALLAAAADAGGLPPEIFLVVGADLVAGLDTWERADELRHLVTVAVVTRPPNGGGPVPARAAPAGWRVQWVDGPQVDVSSSAVRELLEKGESAGDVVPVEVMHCIRRHNLYAVGR